MSRDYDDTPEGWQKLREGVFEFMQKMKKPSEHFGTLGDTVAPPGSTQYPATISVLVPHEKEC